MTVTFDMYCASPPGLEIGSTRILDGCDGLFDQYFDGMPAGQTIRFLVFPGGPTQPPESVDELQALLFVEARVVQANAVDGEVEILSVCPFGDWLRSISPDLLSPVELQALCPEVPITELLATATRHGAAYWKTAAPYWKNLDEPTAVVVLHEEAGTRLAVLRTNAVPSSVFKVAAGAG